MNHWFPIAGFWLAFIFFFLSYLLRNTPACKPLRRISLVCLVVAGILFLGWALARSLSPA